MRKLLCLVLALMVFAAPAFAEGETEEAAFTYDYSVEEGILTVYLSANATTGYEWNMNISDETVAELVTSEYMADDSEPAGAGGTYVASFRAIPDANGASTILFNYARPFETDTPADTFFVVKVSAYESELSVIAAGWLTINDMSTVNIGLEANATTGYEWTSALDETGLIAIDSEDYSPYETDGEMVGVGGEYIAAFSTTMTGAGAANVTLTYAQGEYIATTLTLDMFVDEAGTVTLESVK